MMGGSWGGAQLAATQVWFPFLPPTPPHPSLPHQQHPFPHQNHIRLQRIAGGLLRIYYPGFADRHRFSEALLMKLDIAKEKSVTSQREGGGGGGVRAGVG